jgi:hypothetical protein
MCLSGNYALGSISTKQTAAFSRPTRSHRLDVSLHAQVRFPLIDREPSGITSEGAQCRTLCVTCICVSSRRRILHHIHLTGRLTFRSVTISTETAFNSTVETQRQLPLFDRKSFRHHPCFHHSKSPNRKPCQIGKGMKKPNPPPFSTKAFPR